MTNAFHHQRTLMSPLLSIPDLAHIEQGGDKVLFPGECDRSMTNFHLSLRKELEGKQTHQNVQKNHISGGRNEN